MNQKRRSPALYIGPVLLALLAGILLAACESVPRKIPDGLTQAEFFQRAQEAADNNNWRTSLLYYQTFIDRYPTDRSNVAAARYEIAFIHYKLGMYAQSKTEFEGLLNEYKGPNADQLPEWPKVLGEKILAKVDAHLGEKAAAAGAAPANGSTAAADSGTATP